MDHLDVRFFLRVSHDILKQRRSRRYGYHTAGENLFFMEPSNAQRLTLPLVLTNATRLTSAYL